MLRIHTCVYVSTSLRVPQLALYRASGSSDFHSCDCPRARRSTDTFSPNVRARFTRVLSSISTSHGIGAMVAVFTPPGLRRHKEETKKTPADFTRQVREAFRHGHFRTLHTAELDLKNKTAGPSAHCGSKVCGRPTETSLAMFKKLLI